MGQQLNNQSVKQTTDGMSEWKGRKTTTSLVTYFRPFGSVLSVVVLRPIDQPTDQSIFFLFFRIQRSIYFPVLGT